MFTQVICVLVLCVWSIQMNDIERIAMRVMVLIIACCMALLYVQLL